MKEKEKILYDKSDVLTIMSLEQILLMILGEEEYNEEIKTIHLASICMGLLDTYKSMKKQNKLLKDENKNIEIFINNNKEEIKISTLELLKRFKETDELEENNMKYC